MKKMIALTIIISITMIIFSGCGKTKLQGDLNKQTQGKYFETEYFTMFISDTYTGLPVNSGIQAFKGDKFIEMHVRGNNQTEADIEASINILSKNYEGTTPEKLDIFGISFLHCSIVAQGIPQDVYLAVKNGKKISITLSGQEHDKDEDLKIMFGSIKLK